MPNYKKHTLKAYCDSLAQKAPVPGGGSAAALSGALGAALLCMVARYSQNKGLPAPTEKKLGRILRQCEKIRVKLLDLVERDAAAYLEVSKTRRAKGAPSRKALREAQRVPREICLLCFQAVDMTPFLVEKGSKYLLSDIEVALELLTSAFRSAQIMVAVNQS